MKDVGDERHGERRALGSKRTGRRVKKAPDHNPKMLLSHSRNPPIHVPRESCLRGILRFDALLE
jgi:hypothetical protein